MILHVDPGTEASELESIDDQQFADPQPQSAAQRKKATQEADRMALLLERLSARLLGYALARLEQQQFMAVGQPRDDHGKWTKGAVAFTNYEDAKSIFGERNVPEGRLLGAATMYQTGWAVAVNSDLRAGKKLSGDKKYVVDAMDEMFAKHSIAIDSDAILHRKVRGRLPEEFSDAGFVSTSATHSFAASYEPPKNGRWYAKPDPTDVHMIEIRVPAGTKMLSLLKQGLGQDGKTTEIPEVVLNRGTKFVSDGPGKLRVVK